jgi:hypothetical protein
MGTFGRFALALMPLAFLSAQPVRAADDLREPGMTERRSAAFAGASFRLGLGPKSQRPPTLHLKLGMRHTFRDGGSAAPTSVRESSVLELGVARSGKPVTYVGGRNTSEMKRQSNLLGNTHPVTLVLITALVVTAVFVLSTDLDGEPASDTK